MVWIKQKASKCMKNQMGLFCIHPFLSYRISNECGNLYLYASAVWSRYSAFCALSDPVSNWSVLVLLFLMEAFLPKDSKN